MSATHIRHDQSSSPELPLSHRPDPQPKIESFAIPRKGHVLTTVANRYGSPIRLAVALLADSVSDEIANDVWRELYARRITDPGAAKFRNTNELAAWMTIGAWVTGVATGALKKEATLAQAEAWFHGDIRQPGLASLAPSALCLQAESLLLEVADKSALYDLLPYVLDPHGEGNRISVMLRPETASARASKKEDGVFYTPADVASFMAGQLVGSLLEDAVPLTVFDPACGTGVFLRAALVELKSRNSCSDAFDLACSCLYGADIDPWAVNAAALVLLADCHESISARNIPPIVAWHALRLNIAQVDTLRLDPGRAIPQDSPERILRLNCRSSLKKGFLPVVTEIPQSSGTLEFQHVFPEIAEGARVVMGNPPYANVGKNADVLSLSRRFETFRSAPKSTSDMYPLFVEQMIRLAAPNAHGGAMVLPLSVACNTSRQFVTLRQRISREPGHWQFAFFDREPHALFGEDVKTRNAITLWVRHGSDAGTRISTGPLRKWRGSGRARMLESIGFTETNADIRLGVPKIEGAMQSQLLTRLSQNRYTLSNAATHISRSTLTEAMKGEGNTVFVGATAYNFLNVFLRPDTSADLNDKALTENPMQAVECASRKAALQIFALLSSRVAFWWWHAFGDGFHVSKHVIETMPVGSVLDHPQYAEELARLGSLLWEEISARPVISRNRGKTSLGFSAAASPYRSKIDEVLVRAFNLPPKFAADLERFCDDVTQARMSPPDVKKNEGSLE